MVGQSNAAPAIIKRKKIVVGGSHHGGAWKVAYADFVTAMMAFFLLMWLLNATTEKQRRGLADYFSPSIPISRTSGGGDGAFGGEAIMAENALIHNGSGGATEARMAQPRQENSSDADAARAKAEEEMLAEVERRLLARSGESQTMERLLRHVITRVSDEGLVIELFDLPGAPLFAENTTEATEILDGLAEILAEVLGATTNRLSVTAHTRSYPVVLVANPVWGLSSARAQTLREMVVSSGLADGRFNRVTGHADRKPAVADATHVRNNRLELTLLREGK